MARTASGESSSSSAATSAGLVASAAGRGVRGGVQRGEVRDGCPATVHHGAFEVDGVRGAVADAGATLEMASDAREAEMVERLLEEADELHAVDHAGGADAARWGSRPWFAVRVCLVGSMASVGVGASALASFAGLLFSGAPTQREVVGADVLFAGRGVRVGVWTLAGFEARVVLAARRATRVVGPPSLTPGPTGMPSGVPAPWERIETVFLAGAARRPRLSRDANNDRGRVQRCEGARGDERRARLMFEREAGRGSRGRKGGERRRSMRRRVAQPLQSPRAGTTMMRRTRPRTAVDSDGGKKLGRETADLGDHSPLRVNSHRGARTGDC